MGAEGWQNLAMLAGAGAGLLVLVIITVLAMCREPSTPKGDDPDEPTWT